VKILSPLFLCQKQIQLQGDGPLGEYKEQQ